MTTLSLNSILNPFKNNIYISNIKCIINNPILLSLIIVIILYLILMYFKQLNLSKLCIKSIIISILLITLIITYHNKLQNEKFIKGAGKDMESYFAGIAENSTSNLNKIGGNNDIDYLIDNLNIQKL